MAITGSIYSLAKKETDLTTKQVFENMMSISRDTGAVVIDGRSLAAGSIFAEQIHAKAITAEHIKSGAIETGHMDAGTIDVSVLKGSQLILPGKNYGGVVINNNGLTMKSTDTAKLDIKLSSDSGFNITDRHGNQLIDIDPKTGNVKMEVNQLSIGDYSAATTKDIDDIEVGGRNLLPQSNNFSEGYWDGGREENKERYNSLRIAGGVTAYGPQITLEGNTQYVYSAYVLFDRDTSISNSTPLHRHFIAKGQTPAQSGLKSAELLSSGVAKANVWSRIEILVETSDSESVLMKTILYGILTGTTSWWRNFQIEKGNKATDWRPAPEDVESSIADVDEKAINANASIKDMMSDLKITPIEKTELARSWERIKAEYAQLNSQAASLVVASATRTNYTNAYNALNTNAPRIQTDILASMTTNYNLTTTTRNTFKTKMNTYFVQAETISKAITDKIQANASTASSTADAAKEKTDAWSFQGTTEIDGTSIRTGTISADRIDVNTLSAITANLGTVNAGSLNGKNLTMDLTTGDLKVMGQMTHTYGATEDAVISMKDGAVTSEGVGFLKNKAILSAGKLFLTDSSGTYFQSELSVSGLTVGGQSGEITTYKSRGVSLKSRAESGHSYDAEIDLTVSRNGVSGLALNGRTVRIALDGERANIRVNNAHVVGSGNNSNGDWLQFYDGTQICWCSSTSVTHWDWTYPKEFVGSTPKVFAMGVVDSRNWQSSKTISSIRISSNVANSRQAVAFGRWKA